jgi:hypothetical protein
MPTENLLEHRECFSLLLKVYVPYIVVKTKYTTNHIEKLMPTCSDRGRWKWIAETNYDAFDKMRDDEEAQNSHIDGADCFPRFYFRDESLVTELFAWIMRRDLTIIQMETPPI